MWSTSAFNHSLWPYLKSMHVSLGTIEPLQKRWSKLNCQEIKPFLAFFCFVWLLRFPGKGGGGARHPDRPVPQTGQQQVFISSPPETQIQLQIQRNWEKYKYKDIQTDLCPEQDNNRFASPHRIQIQLQIHIQGHPDKYEYKDIQTEQCCKKDTNKFVLQPP